jgi:hypothetical protein
MQSSISIPIALAFWFLIFASAIAHAGESIQPGFYSHEPANVGIRIRDARSGELCADHAGVDNVCSTETMLIVKGADTCLGDDRKPYPCTRYGYRYDYEGATPGSTIQCRATRNDGFKKRSKDYVIELGSDAGSVSQSEWVGYGPVNRRTILTEVHECSYRGERLTTIEYIITYEPSLNPAASLPTATTDGGPHPDVDEPYIDEVPDACLYLTPGVAMEWVRDGDIQNNHGEHFPIFRSLCWYSAIHAAERNAQLEFRFQLYDLYDIEKISRPQLIFNATFAGGGNEPQEILRNLGKISFIYELPNDVTAVMIIMGTQGPPDGAGRPMEFTATLSLRDPGRDHQSRRKLLIEFARENLDTWLGPYAQ